MPFIVSPLVFLSPVFLELVSSWSRMGARAALFYISLQRGCSKQDSPIVSVILGKSKRPVWIQKPYWSSTSKRVVFFKLLPSHYCSERGNFVITTAMSERMRKREKSGGLCVLPCLGFQCPDDYMLIPGDSFPTQEILPSVRVTEEMILLPSITRTESLTSEPRWSLLCHLDIWFL